MRGQGYDGAAAIRGQFRGVQDVIKETYSKAIYSHCVSYSQNLFLSRCFQSLEYQKFLWNFIWDLHFFHSSAKRSENLKSPEAWKTWKKLRHKVVFVFKEFLVPIATSLEDIRKASNIIYSICHFFFVSLSVAAKMLGHSYNLSQYLQRINLDFVSAISQGEHVISVLKNIRENASSIFHIIYEETKCSAASFNVEESVPRVCGIQRNQQNFRLETAEEHYKEAIFVPYIDDFLAALNNWFITYNWTTIAMH
ncbi:hypothetical protein PR048_020186 [Dryococelus australis]|uniref:Uncharacterized protein n=1 Tax=Dryococelus australis TaxID=614101 RepID=A0ABQ9H5Z1_9NEOP|nr:hypothetical protein PR048_020186 [Dryococelus australis]